jgi:hypothetical protein
LLYHFNTYLVKTLLFHNIEYFMINYYFSFSFESEGESAFKPLFKFFSSQYNSQQVLLFDIFMHNAKVKNQNIIKFKLTF